MRIYLMALLFLFSFTNAKYIHQTTEDRQEIPCNEIEISHGRLWGDDWHYIINSQKEYRGIIGGKSEIDFTKYTLLGVVAATGGCRAPTLSHSVYYSKQSNSYQYELTVQQNGGCENIFHAKQWCLISKIASDSKVEFIKKETISNQ